MSFIRKMKSQGHSSGEKYDETFLSFRNKIKGQNQTNEFWDPNATHCFYGLDADLIMLSLVTHEPHFSLLRENALNQEKPENLKEIEPKKPQKSPSKNNNYASKKKPSKNSKKQDDFQLLHISILREYLDEEFRDSLHENDLFQYDLERIIDDFVFMCYFIGNDFLPNLPFLDISEQALNVMFQMYKDNLREFGDYLTFHGTINPNHVKHFYLM